MSTKTFANNLIRTQRVFGLNNSDLALVLGPSRRTLGRIKGAIEDYTPQNVTIAKIARAYDVTTSEVTSRLPAATIAAVL